VDDIVDLDVHKRLLYTEQFHVVYHYRCVRTIQSDSRLHWRPSNDNYRLNV